jgi:hypothetical protein
MSAASLLANAMSLLVAALTSSCDTIFVAVLLIRSM